MIVRDEQGQIEVGIGDQFKVREATFSVICAELSKASNPSVWVRLESGTLVLTDGRRVEFRPELHGGGHMDQVFLFTGDLVARCVREHRLLTFDIAEPASQQPAQSVAKTPRARTSKKDAGKSQPNSGSLF